MLEKAILSLIILNECVDDVDYENIRMNEWIRNKKSGKRQN